MFGNEKREHLKVKILESELASIEATSVLYGYTSAYKDLCKKEFNDRMLERGGFRFCVLVKEHGVFRFDYYGDQYFTFNDALKPSVSLSKVEFTKAGTAVVNPRTKSFFTEYLMSEHATIVTEESAKPQKAQKPPKPVKVIPTPPFDMEFIANKAKVKATLRQILAAVEAGRISVYWPNYAQEISRIFVDVDTHEIKAIKESGSCGMISVRASDLKNIIENKTFSVESFGLSEKDKEMAHTYGKTDGVRRLRIPNTTLYQSINISISDLCMDLTDIAKIKPAKKGQP